MHLHFGARNYLTGPIPPELANLSKLVQFYAAGRNALTGPIPAGFGSIRSLAALHLTGNRLTGVIPDLGGTTCRASTCAATSSPAGYRSGWAG